MIPLVARTTVLIVALSVMMVAPVGTRASAAASVDRPPGQLTINGGRAVSRSHPGDLMGYATCPDGRAPGVLDSDQLDLGGDWYSTSPYGGYWGQLAVRAAATPGRYTATVDCRRGGSPSAEFTIVP